MIFPRKVIADSNTKHRDGCLQWYGYSWESYVGHSEIGFSREKTSLCFVCVELFQVIGPPLENCCQVYISFLFVSDLASWYWSPRRKNGMEGRIVREAMYAVKAILELELIPAEKQHLWVESQIKLHLPAQAIKWKLARSPWCELDRMPWRCHG